MDLLVKLCSKRHICCHKILWTVWFLSGREPCLRLFDQPKQAAGIGDFTFSAYPDRLKMSWMWDPCKHKAAVGQRAWRALLYLRSFYDRNATGQNTAHSGALRCAGVQLIVSTHCCGWLTHCSRKLPIIVTHRWTLITSKHSSCIHEEWRLH